MENTVFIVIFLAGVISIKGAVPCARRTTGGKCCVFPFTYKGIKYDKCTKKNHNKLWCSTTANYNGQWGNCKACIKKTTSGKCCVFPFTYKRVKYDKCTKKNHNKLWCATTANYDADYQWGDCQDCKQETTSGKCCVVPFTYKGVQYDKCTAIDNGGKPWCATTANYGTDKQWEECLKSCL